MEVGSGFWLRVGSNISMALRVEIRFQSLILRLRLGSRFSFLGKGSGFGMEARSVLGTWMGSGF